MRPLRPKATTTMARSCLARRSYGGSMTTPVGTGVFVGRSGPTLVPAGRPSTAHLPPGSAWVNRPITGEVERLIRDITCAQ